jgi:hypothetical protein
MNPCLQMIEKPNNSNTPSVVIAQQIPLISQATSTPTLGLSKVVVANTWPPHESADMFSAQPTAGALDVGMLIVDDDGTIKGGGRRVIVVSELDAVDVIVDEGWPHRACGEGARLDWEGVRMKTRA